MKPKARIGLVGCGNISTMYLKNCARFENLEVAAVADLDPKRAEAQAAAFGIPRVLSLPRLVEDDVIDIVLNLTNPAAHAEVALAALRHGKSVYNEKPLAVRLESAAEMLEIAHAAGLRVGCAPDTFLGSSLQLCRSLLDQGVIGEVTAAVGFMLAGGPERWHPDPFFFYQPGAGPLFDMGPYYLTALTTLLGPVCRVSGCARITSPTRAIGSEPRRGELIDVQTPTHIAGTLDFTAGPVATIITSFDTPGENHLPYIEIYGALGTMKVPDPNCYDGEVLINKTGGKQWEEVPSRFGYTENSRALGLADMAMAIRSGRPHRANGETGYHVLEIMHGILDSSSQGRHVAIKSSMTRPEPFPEALTFGTVPE
jgi:predicted dehydrogenase